MGSVIPEPLSVPRTVLGDQSPVQLLHPQAGPLGALDSRIDRGYLKWSLRSVSDSRRGTGDVMLKGQRSDEFLERVAVGNGGSVGFRIKRVIRSHDAVS